MAVLEISTAAQADFRLLGQDGVERFGFSATEAYLQRITAALARLEQFPESAPLLAWREDGVRRLNVGSHVAFYRLEGDVVRVLRILHQRMEPARHL